LILKNFLADLKRLQHSCDKVHQSKNDRKKFAKSFVNAHHIDFLNVYMVYMVGTYKTICELLRSFFGWSALSQEY